MHQLHPFFSVLGFQLCLIRSGSRWRVEQKSREMKWGEVLDSSRLVAQDVGMQHGESGGFPTQFQPQKTLLQRTDHQKCQLSQEVFWIETPLFRTKGEFLYFPFFVTSVQLLLVDTQFRHIQAHVSAKQKCFRSVVLNA